ncbi:MAG: aminotransferase class V-fold PLP-dependent enzyme [Spirochaetales bacterium]|nr:aminotransferase class V-fold PLP-dependent enzyme [Spirochaetales bacterium]
MNFNRDPALYPVNREGIFLASCAVAPLYAPAMDAARSILELQSRGDFSYFEQNPVEKLKEKAALLLCTESSNISFMKNTTEGLSLIAAGYPWKEGDEIISTSVEYPANHYPWRVAEKKGAVLKEIKPDPQSHSWDLEQLESLISSRSRVVALSQVQFTSGFAINLEELSRITRKYGLDLIIDAAQSLGALPLDAGRSGAAAIAASGWKWLLGPAGSGLLYTTPEFRKKLSLVFAGAETMRQGADYLNHSWDPHESGKFFEYSTPHFALAAALQTSLSEVTLHYGVPAINKELLRLQDRLLEGSPRARKHALLFPPEARSGILALYLEDPAPVAQGLKAAGIVVRERSHFLRISPHIFNSDEQMDHTARLLEELLPD